jgi:hypothetical protein
MVQAGAQAIVVYPMNALANSQVNELNKFLGLGYADGRGPVTFARYTGQERPDDRASILAHPPDIILAGGTGEDTFIFAETAAVNSASSASSPSMVSRSWSIITRA